MPIEPCLRNKKNHRKKPLILVTNDDGYFAPGVIALTKSLKGLGKVVVVAPDREMSAVSHSITFYRPLRIYTKGIDIYAVDGTPTDCINIGINKILKEVPDIIVSGINPTPNVGEDMHYSGTVSAAIEGAIFGIPSIAVSITDGHENTYRYAAAFARRVAKKILDEGFGEGIVLNINVPPKRKGTERCEFTVQGKKKYGDIISEKIDPRGKKYYWIGGYTTNFEPIPNSDCKVVVEGSISITPIRVDITDYKLLGRIKNWKV